MAAIQRDVLRISTAGSVDDGKSTLIGRLLYDSKAIPDDQYAAIQRAGGASEGQPINLALLTDGLRAEREQQITIDVAYRFFATDRRRFIIADTPGHAQYTRNMVTGASTADLAIILVDARKGLLPQSRRHAAVAALLGVPHLVLAVNKMDLVEYRQEVFDSITAEFTAYAKRLGVKQVTAFPISALLGDNVVDRSANMPWFDGAPLLEFLQTVPRVNTLALAPFRFPVQCVLRPDASFRGYAGAVASGTVAVGDTVIALPSGKRTRVREVQTPDGPVSTAGTDASVVLVLEDEIDAGRGEVLAHVGSAPEVASAVTATVCWMSETPLTPGGRYVLAQGTREVSARVTATHYHLDPETLNQDAAESLELNHLGSVSLQLAQPAAWDTYATNRVTGAFILIDPLTNVPVAAGMVTEIQAMGRASAKSYRAVAEARNGHTARLVFVKGSLVLAAELDRRLAESGIRTGFLGPELDAAVVAPVFLEHGAVTLVVGGASFVELGSESPVVVELVNPVDVTAALSLILRETRLSG